MEEAYFVRKPTPPRTTFIDWLLLTGAFALENIAPYSRPHIWFEAKVDARIGIALNPAPDAKDYTPFQKEMYHWFLKRKDQERAKAIRIRTYLKGEIERYEISIPAMEVRLQREVKPQHEEAEAEMKQLNKACGAHRHKTKLWFYIGSTMLLLPDFALQFPAFEQEGLAGWQTGLICGAIAGLTGWLADTFGYAVNHKKHFQVVFIPTLMTALFGVIAFVRLANFAQVSQELEIAIAPEVIALAYFLVNVAIFSIIAMQSTQLHNREEEKCHRDKSAAAKKFEATAKELNGLMALLASDKAAQADATAKFEASPEDENHVLDGLDEEFNSKRQSYLKTYTRTARRSGLLR